MEVNVDSRIMEFMIQDMRPTPEEDAMYAAAVELAEEIMEDLSGQVLLKLLPSISHNQVLSSIFSPVPLTMSLWIACLQVH